ncbi:chorismate mutase [Lactobacillus sp. CRM56-3]|uniref:Chorismate mutase n=2 Tax=Secundilactobacillus folii TaxID=2678357 RepID=A0A7X3C3T7_9LACO|nr:chorismate mutase [Secundilactobacillus folii]
METKDNASGAWRPNELAAARQQINQIDDQIVKLLAQRFDAVTKVNEAKQSADLPVMDQGREDQVLDRVTNKDPNPETHVYMRQIFETIMKNSRDYQTHLTNTDSNH